MDNFSLLNSNRLSQFGHVEQCDPDNPTFMEIYYIVITGYKWGYTFYKWGYKYLELVKA